MDSFVVKGLIWLMLAALIYHLVAGIRHILMDMGVGGSLAGGRLGARLVLIISVIFILMMGINLSLFKKLSQHSLCQGGKEKTKRT